MRGVARSHRPPEGLRQALAVRRASILAFGGFAALGFIVVAMLTGIAIGPMFTYLMIAFACGNILYDTSNVLHQYRIGQHVAAALALFASVALLFWYLVQLFSRRN